MVKLKITEAENGFIITDDTARIIVVDTEGDKHEAISAQKLFQTIWSQWFYKSKHEAFPQITVIGPGGEVWDQ